MLSLDFGDMMDLGIMEVPIWFLSFGILGAVIITIVLELIKTL